MTETVPRFDECLTILNTINAKETPTETPQPPALGGLVKMVETLSTRFVFLARIMTFSY